MTPDRRPLTAEEIAVLRESGVRFPPSDLVNRMLATIDAERTRHAPPAPLMSKGEADARIDLMKMTKQRDDLLEALAATPAMLDVERLARAYAIVTENSDTAWDDDPEMHESWRSDAAAIAAAYAEETP